MKMKIHQQHVEHTQSSCQAKQHVIKIGVSNRGRGRVRDIRGFGSRK